MPGNSEIQALREELEDLHVTMDVMEAHASQLETRIEVLKEREVTA